MSAFYFGGIYLCSYLSIPAPSPCFRSTDESAAHLVWPEAQSARNREDTMTATTPLNPGDEAAPGTPGTGENICGHCKGRGSMENGQPCPMCDGTGKVTEGIGGG
jgi:hypothetical protein